MWVGIGVGIGRNRFATGIFNAYALRVTADGGITEAGQCVDAVSGLLLNASLLLVPSGYKGGKLYSEIPTNGNGDLTWTRSGTANRTNASGNIELMGANVPRLSYMYGSCPALLLEPQRTNLCLQSETFDNASWTKDSSATVTANTTTAPDGNTTADTINLAAVANSRINQVININNSTTYTVSGYFKNIALASGENISLIYGNTNAFGAPNNFTATASIDLFNGTATYSLTGTSGTGFSGSASGSIQNVGNGWFRVTLTFTTGSSAATGGVFRLISSTVASARSFYAWGMQMELGAYPTTYIPTTSATATRVADSFSRNNIYTNGLITSSGGTWFVELRNNVAYVRDSSLVGLFLGDTSAGQTNSFAISCPTGNDRLRIGKFFGGYAQLFQTTTNTVKIAIKWNGSTADIFVNGTKQVSATAFTATALEFLAHSTSVDVPKFIQQMALFPSPLSDTDCQTITAL